MSALLFGPPGIGKSTLVRYLNKLGFKAFDLEDVSRDLRASFAKNLLSAGYIVAAADLSPANDYGACKILLYAEQKQLDYRRYVRDTKLPWKKNQKYHKMDEWGPFSQYDFVIDTSHGNIFRTLADIYDKVDLGIFPDCF